MNKLWESRQLALSVLAEQYPEVCEVFDQLFAVVDECVAALWAVESPFGRVTALVVIKSRNLAHGCYSLTLDSLAQESGALFRPLVECYELLEYFRRDPSRIEEILDGRLPKAGEIAKRIKGQFKGLREYLNQHASHLSIGPESMSHLLDLYTDESRVFFRLQQPFRPSVVLKNLRTLFGAFVLIGIEAVNCTFIAGSPAQTELANRVETLKTRGLRVLEEAVGAMET